MTLALSLLPRKPQTLLSDNGAEFEADFGRTLARQGIARWYTYPKTPQMNAHIERFNRTLQESFVDYHEDLFFTDLNLFNQKLADLSACNAQAGWLVFYNAHRPHHCSPLPWGFPLRGPLTRSKFVPDELVPRPTLAAILPPPTPTRVPKVVDAYIDIIFDQPDDMGINQKRKAEYSAYLGSGSHEKLHPAV